MYRPFSLVLDISTSILAFSMMLVLILEDGKWDINLFAFLSILQPFMPALLYKEGTYYANIANSNKGIQDAVRVYGNKAFQIVNSISIFLSLVLCIGILTLICSKLQSFTSINANYQAIILLAILALSYVYKAVSMPMACILFGMLLILSIVSPYLNFLQHANIDIVKIIQHMPYVSNGHLAGIIIALPMIIFFPPLSSLPFDFNGVKPKELKFIIMLSTILVASIVVPVCYLAQHDTPPINTYTITCSIIVLFTVAPRIIGRLLDIIVDRSEYVLNLKRNRNNKVIRVTALTIVGLSILLDIYSLELESRVIISSLEYLFVLYVMVVVVPLVILRMLITPKVVTFIVSLFTGLFITAYFWVTGAGSFERLLIYSTILCTLSGLAASYLTNKHGHKLSWRQYLQSLAYSFQIYTFNLFTEHNKASKLSALVLINYAIPIIFWNYNEANFGFWLKLHTVCVILAIILLTRDYIKKPLLIAIVWWSLLTIYLPYNTFLGAAVSDFKLYWMVSIVMALTILHLMLESYIEILLLQVVALLLICLLNEEIFSVIVDSRKYFFYIIVFSNGLSAIIKLFASNALSDKLELASKIAKSISHDIKSPLASIQMGAETLASISNKMNKQALDNTDQEILNYIPKEIHYTSKRALQCIDTTLYSIQCFSVSIPNQEVRYAQETLKQILDSYQMSESDSMRVKIVESSVDFRFVSNFSNFKYIVFNLLNNFFKHASSKALLEIYFSNQRIHFKQYGHRLHPRRKFSIFLPFTTESNRRLGMGLAFATYAMKNLGGDISCINNKDEMEFVLHFPPVCG